MAAPMALAAITPAAGPDSIERTGSASTREAGREPPFEVMIETSACTPTADNCRLNSPM